MRLPPLYGQAKTVGEAIAQKPLAALTELTDTGVQEQVLQM